MSLNLLFLVFSASLAVGNILVLRLPEGKRSQYDRWLFWVASTLLILFAAFRPLGVGVDDINYNRNSLKIACPTFDCGQWMQGRRDQVWYSIVGLLKSFYPHTQVALWLAGLGLAFKLFVIDRLCRYRSLALFFYLACFYIIHDITALRVSLAISVYLLGFYWLVQGNFRPGAWMLVINGFFHKQAFLAPLILLGRWVGRSPTWVSGLLLLPFFLLTMDIYPNARVVGAVQGLPYGEQLITLLAGNEKGNVKYLNEATRGAFDSIRLWPVVVPPTLLFAVWLLPDLLRLKSKSLFCYSGTSLVLAAWLLWFYAIFHVIQIRLWDFFLLPIVFVIGNVHLTRWKLVAILALSMVYLLKYTVIHDLLLDQRQVHLDTPMGGRIGFYRTTVIACGEGCGFNVTQGTTAMLKALPDKGYRFDGWTGACESTDKVVCSVLVEDDITLGARFVRTFAASLTVKGQGKVRSSRGTVCTGSCNWHPDVGGEFGLSADPATGWRFAGWGGACSGNEARCVLDTDTDQSVTAEFVQLFPVHLVSGSGGTVEGLPEGIGDCAVGCDRTIDAGTTLNLQAVPEPSYRFAGWTGACQGQEALCTVTVRAPLTVGATFALKQPGL